MPLLTLLLLLLALMLLLLLISNAAAAAALESFLCFVQSFPNLFSKVTVFCVHRSYEHAAYNWFNLGIQRLH